MISHMKAHQRFITSWSGRVASLWSSDRVRMPKRWWSSGSSQIEVPVDATEATILETAKADDKIKPLIDGKPIKREIYVKGRLVNLVV